MHVRDFLSNITKLKKNTDNLTRAMTPLFGNSKFQNKTRRSLYCVECKSKLNSKRVCCGLTHAKYVTTSTIEPVRKHDSRLVEVYDDDKKCLLLPPEHLYVHDPRLMTESVKRYFGIKTTGKGRGCKRKNKQFYLSTNITDKIRQVTSLKWKSKVSLLQALDGNSDPVTSQIKNIVKKLRKADINETNVSRMFAEKILKKRKKDNDKTPMDLPIAFGSIKDRFAKGKDNMWRRTMLALKPDRMCRCVAGCDPFLKGHQLRLSNRIGRAIGFPKSAIVVRYPSLDTGNMTVHEEIIYTDEVDVVYLPSSVLQRHNCDMDGDEVNVVALNYPESIEVILRLSPRHDFMSMGYPKLNFSSDVKMGLGFDGDGNPRWEREMANLERLYVETGDSASCYNRFCELERLGYDHVHRYGALTYDTLDTFARLKCTRFSTSHMRLLREELGVQRFSVNNNPIREHVSDSYRRGLSKENFITHMQAGRDAMIESGGMKISVNGQNLYRLCFCLPEAIRECDETLRINNKIVSEDAEEHHPLRKIKKMACRKPIRHIEVVRRFDRNSLITETSVVDFEETVYRSSLESVEFLNVNADDVWGNAKLDRFFETELGAREGDVIRVTTRNNNVYTLSMIK